MTTFAESEIRMRRFLRDPDALIWSSDDLMAYYNDAQIEMAMKTGLLVRVENHYYPPQYDGAYLFDWERDYAGGTRYQALVVNQANGDVVSYVWEPAYYLSDIQTTDEDYRYTQSWESHYVSTAETPAVPLHTKFDKMLYIAYDENRLYPIDKKELETNDPFYKDRVGEVTHYWRPDDYSNIFYPYPKPSLSLQQGTIYYILTEGGDYIEAENGGYILTEDGEYVLREEIFADGGGINTSDEEWLDEGDIGIVTDIIDCEDALLMIYQAQPYDIAETVDVSDYPDWAVKYIEYATLERAFGADTDGHIPSLRDYWKARKELGIKALLRFKRMSLVDRDYRLGGMTNIIRSSRLRLPDGYPAV